VLSRILLLRDWNIAAAESESLRAITLDPAAPEARGAHALCLRSAGRLAEAIVERQHAQRADPLNPQTLVFLGDEYVLARRFEDARRAYHLALEIERDFGNAVASLADVHARLGRHTEAAEWMHRWLILRAQTETAARFDERRRHEGPRAALDWLDRWNIGQFERAQDGHFWDLAYLHARVGNRETAIQFLERAYSQHEWSLLLARVDPDLDSLRSDPRFADLLRRIGPS
jgi:tetratricopeptide (TPR) repeat protein